MTDSLQRPGVAVLLVSPAAAALLALTTSWALHQSQKPSAAPTPRASSASSPFTSLLREDLTAAAADLQRTQTSVLRLRTAVSGRADRLRTLETRLHTIGAGGSSRSAPVPSATATGTRTPVHAPAPVPVPAAPPVSTTTGAS
jgi:hypothetical protein